MIARLRDALRELRIRWLLCRVTHCASIETRRQLWRALCAEVRARSPAQIARMEQAL